MAISRDIFQQLLSLLRAHMKDEKQRQMYLIWALGRDAPVLHRLVWNEPVDVFITSMVQELVDYGEIVPGEPALCALLEVIREKVGVDIQVRIDELLLQIREELKQPENLQSNSNRVTETRVDIQGVDLSFPELLLSERGVDYARLRDLLASGKWKEADRETATVMLKAAGREQEGWLRVEDIEKFPCQDLHTIDTLWVKYSKGHFGFSVQKRIWLEVGGKVDYKTELYLGDRVGWCVQGNWLKYSELTFSLKAPQGHIPARLVGAGPSLEVMLGVLPRSFWGSVPLSSDLCSRSLDFPGRLGMAGWVWCWAGLCLFSRIETCKL